MNLEIDLSLSYTMDSDKIAKLQEFIDNNDIIKQQLKNITIDHNGCTYLRLNINSDEIYSFNYTMYTGNVVQDQEIFITRDHNEFEKIRILLLEFIRDNLIESGGQ